MSETERGRTDHQGHTGASIATALRERMALGELKPGDAIPTLQDLMGEYSVAKATVSRAMDRLRSEGLIETRPGLHTRVVHKRAGVSPSDQFDRVRRTGRIRLANEQTVVLQTGEMAAEKLLVHVRESLGLTSQSPDVLYRKRLIRREEKPEFMVTSWFPVVHFSMRKGWDNVRAQLLSYDKIGQSTFAFIADFLGEEVDHEDQTFSASAASVDEASNLNVKPGSPVLRTLATSYSTSRVPIECGLYSYGANVSVSAHPAT